MIVGTSLQSSSPRRFLMRAYTIGWMISATLFGSTARAADVIGDAKPDRDGFLVHEVRSDTQAGPTKIRVLLPDTIEKDKRYPVVYVLPVEARDETRFGDGLVEVKKHNLHNR